MGRLPGSVIEYATPLARGPEFQRRSVNHGVAAAVAGTAAWGVARFCPAGPLIFLGIFGIYAAPVLSFSAFVYAIRGIVSEGRVGRAGIALLLVALSLTACFCAFLVVMDGEHPH